jgi:hypothetical protein
MSIIKRLEIRPDNAHTKNMKSFFIIFLLLTVCLLSAGAQPKTLRIASIPATMEELVALRDKIAGDPEGGAIVFIIAMLLYAQDHQLGLQAFTLALDRSELTKGDVYKGYQPYRVWEDKFAQIDKYPYLGRVYIQGTRAEDGYKLPGAPYSFVFKEIREGTGGSMTVFVETTGGNLPRPVKLIRNDRGYWKVSEASSLFVGVSKLPPDNPDAADDL